MNKLNYIFILFIASLTFASCGDNFDNSAEPSDVTFLPAINLEGASSVILDCNETSFTDPGGAANEGGSPIDISSGLAGDYFGSTEVNAPDIYTITYAALNKDGIPASAFRQVVLPPCNGDFVTSIAGLYSSSIVRIGGEAYDDRTFVVIRETSTPGTFEISDAFGGFYDLGRGFGAQCAAVGATIKMNAANDFDVTTGSVFCFGPEFVITMENFSADAATKTISFVATGTFANAEFTATMVQIPQ